MSTAAPAADYLARTIQTEDTTTYLWAYPAVTLVPFANIGSGTAWNGTPIVNVAEGSAAPKNIRIYAELIYIWDGSSFDWPGTNVTIVARQVCVVATGAAQGNVFFNLQAPDPPAAKLPALAGARGADATDSSGATAGGVGADGNDGDKGADAGVLGQQGSNGDSNPGWFGNIVMSAAGGAGQNGQPGGPGGAGGNGYRTDSVSSFGTDPINEGNANAANGGPGGRGGKGGAFGVGGGLLAWCTPPFAQTLALAHNYVSWPTVTNALSGGYGGSGGAGGLGGNGGGWKFVAEFPMMPPNVAQISGSAGSEGASGSGGSGAQAGLSAMSQFEVGVTLEDPTGDAAPQYLKPLFLNSTHMIMVLQRLVFEYQLLYATQPDFDSDQTIAARRAQFQVSMEWLRSYVQVFQSGQDPFSSLSQDRSLDMIGLEQYFTSATLGAQDEWTNPSTQGGLQNAVDAFDQFQSLCFSGTVSDIYGNALNWVPQPNLSVSLVQGLIQNLKDLETQKAALETVLVASQVERDKIQSESTKLLSLLKSYSTDLQAIIADMDDAYAKIQSAQKTLGQKTQAAQTALSDLWHYVADQFNCGDLSQVLSAVGSVCLFAQPELSASLVAGGVLSTGSAASGLFTTVSTTNGTFDKSAFLGQVEAINGSLDSNDMLTQLKQKHDIIAAADPTFYKMIVAEQASFNSLCQTLFQSLDSKAGAQEVQSAQAAFQEMVDAAQAVSQAIIKFNSGALKYRKTQVAQARAQATINTLENSQTQYLAPPEVYLMYGFLCDTYSNAQSALIELVFDTVRACDALFLTASSIPGALLGAASCFENLTADMLADAFHGPLATDVNNYAATANAHPIAQQALTVSLTDSSNPSMLRDLRANGTLYLTLTPENASDYGFDPSWFDVRLDDLQVYLVGARNTQVNAPPVPQPINLTVTLGDVFSVKDAAGSVHDFAVPIKSITCSYTDSQGNYTDTASHMTDLEAFDFSLSWDDGTNIKLPPAAIASPLARWTISADAGIDVSTVTEVRLLLKLSLRAAATSLAAAKPLVMAAPLATAEPLLTAAPLKLSSSITDARPMSDIQAVHVEQLPVLAQGLFSQGLRIVFNKLQPMIGERRTVASELIGAAAGPLFTPFTQNMSLSIVPAGDFVPMGASPAQMAQGMVQNSRSVVFENCAAGFATNFKTKFAALTGADRYSTMATDYLVTAQGHLGQVAGIQQFPNAGDFNKSEYMSKLRFDSIALGVRYIAPTTAAYVRTLSTGQAYSYITANKAEMASEFSDYYKNGGSLVGCSAILGNNSMINFNDVSTFTKGTLTIQSAIVSTAKLHPYSGANAHLTITDTERPDEVMYANIGVGQHTQLYADQLNAIMQEYLWGNLYKTAPILHAALQNGQSLDAALAAYPDLRRSRAIFNWMDQWSYIGITGKVEAGIDNTTKTVLITDSNGGDTSLVLQNLSAEDIANGNHPTTTDPPGVYIDGVARSGGALACGEDTSVASSSLLNPLYTDDQATITATINDRAKYSQGPQDLALLKQKITAAVQARLPNIADPSRPTEEIFNELCDSYGLGIELRKQLFSALYSPVADQVADDLARNAALSTNLAPSMVADAAGKIAYTQTVDALMQPGGLAPLWAYSSIEPAVATAVTGLDLEQRLQSDVNAASAASQKFAADQAAVNSMAPGDPGLEQAEQKLREDQEQLAEDQAATASSTELKDIKDNEPARSANRDQEAQTEEDSEFKPPPPPPPPSNLANGAGQNNTLSSHSAGASAISSPEKKDRVVVTERLVVPDPVVDVN